MRRVTIIYICSLLDIVIGTVVVVVTLRLIGINI